MTQSAAMLLGGLPVTLLAIVFLGITVHAQQRRDGGAPPRLNAADREKLAVEADELERVAAEVLELAREAVHTAERTAAELAEAEAARDVAWQEHVAATELLDEANAAAAALPTETPLPEGDLREVARAARAAFKRGDITAQQLHAVWQHVDGWDQQRQDHYHDLLRRRADDAEAARRFHIAAGKERAARRAAEVARQASHALTQEAADAAYEAQVVKNLIRDTARRRWRRTNA
ncbi:hypothetical protein [Catellatospora tritici]|uniref:hypothetical protein n=1 Tax=Catellatospora tritici TaxID=2851566 RepID=UPI001C2CF3C6|nr:hypothetical protein [Catellatospora tritici]MBV1856053.1 hypothetical protein [Catellatospora tritici]